MKTTYCIEQQGNGQWRIGVLLDGFEIATITEETIEGALSYCSISRALS